MTNLRSMIAVLPTEGAVHDLATHAISMPLGVLNED